MARFVRMMLNRGELDGVKIVSPESIARMETPETSLAARAGLKDGYGLGNYEDEKEPLTQHGHDGGIDGFLSRYAYVPEAGVGYFFSINDFSMRGKDEAAVNEIAHLLYAYMTRGATLIRSPRRNCRRVRRSGPVTTSPRRRGSRSCSTLICCWAADSSARKDGRFYLRSVFGIADR